jgi:hypothetical protein
LFDGTKKEIALVYLPGTIAHIKESEKEDIASPKALWLKYGGDLWRENLSY